MKIIISECTDTKRYLLARKDFPRISRRVRRTLAAAKRGTSCAEMELRVEPGGEVAVAFDGCPIATLAHRPAEAWWRLINEMARRKVTLCATVVMAEHTWWVELPSIEAAIETINHTNVQISYEDF
ncbi:MAG: hypothetical protein Q4D85_08595 [Corynebacterium sp.]|uniref:hypothetical protein n=1 Tax=Corynebacterium sp. TaxID=1720 RepID=UPI0026DC233F|nr:hypothetical protein [Corynebacterium sp.]MDO5098805.1 hypothetical protein [Corynebacterium sp.]